jgi:hypothetical protein
MLSSCYKYIVVGGYAGGVRFYKMCKLTLETDGHMKIFRNLGNNPRRRKREDISVSPNRISVSAISVLASA